MADNEIVIKVKSENDTKAGFDAAKTDAEVAGEDVAQGFSSRFGSRLSSLVRRDAETAGDEAGAGFMAKFGSWLIGGQSQFGGGGIGGILKTAFSSGPVGIAGLAVAIGAALTELVGLVNGLTAAAAGIGALGLVALPTLDKIKNAYTAISAAQTALAGAKAKEALAPSKANEAAVKNAQITLDLAQKSAGPVAGAVAGVQNLAGAFGKMATSFQPQVLQIFNQAIGIAAQLLPTVATFAQAAAPAVEEVMKQLSKGINSQGFKDFVSQFSKISGPAIEAIGAGFGKVAGAVGHLLTVMSAHDVVHALNIAFDVLAGIISGLEGTVHGLMIAWDQASSHIAAFAKAAARDLANWAQVVDNMVSNVVHWITVTVPGAFSTAFNAVKGFLVRAMTDMANWAQNVDDWINKVVTWFLGLPGRIKAALGTLASDMLSIGKGIIQGIMNGIDSMVGSLIAKAKSVASHIKSAFAAALKIFSPSQVFAEYGKNIVLGLVQGLDHNGSQATSAAQRLARNVLPGGVSGHGGGLGVTLEIGSTGNQNFDAFMLQWLRNNVRLKGGGSVQAAFGKAGM